MLALAAMPWSTWSMLVKRAIMLELRIRQQLSQRRRRRWSSSFERAIMLEHQIRRGYHKPMALAIDQHQEKSELLNCRSRMPLRDVCTEEQQKARSSWSARVVASWHSSSVQARRAILLRRPIRQALSPAYWLTLQMANLWMYIV